MQACLEGEVQQLIIHAVLLGQPHPVVVPARLAKVVHRLRYLYQQLATL